MTTNKAGKYYTIEPGCDKVLSRQNCRELENDPEIWRNALEIRGLKVSRAGATRSI